MEFEVIWSDSAELQLDQIFDYYIEHASYRVAKDLILGIISEPNKLLKNVEIGQIEDLLLDRENKYRYIIYKSYKIIYSIDISNRQIKVADVFDTRQNPIDLKRTK